MRFCGLFLLLFAVATDPLSAAPRVSRHVAMIAKVRSSAPFSMYHAGWLCGSSGGCVLSLYATMPTQQKVVDLNVPSGISFTSVISNLAVGGQELFANDGTKVTGFRLGDIAPIARFQDSGTIMAASASDTLYIAHAGGINVYLPGTSQPSRTITDGVTNVTALAIGKNGRELFVSNGNNIVVYPVNGQTALRTITSGINDAQLLAFDSLGRLVVYNSGDRSITIYPVNGVAPVKTITAVLQGSALAIGPSNTIYVVRADANVVDEYDREGPTLSREIAHFAQTPELPWVDDQDTLYIMNDSHRPSVSTYPSKSTKPSSRWRIPSESCAPSAFVAGTVW